MPYAALTRRLPSGATSPGSVLAYPQAAAKQVIVQQPADATGPREAVDTLGTTDLATRYVGSLYSGAVIADNPDLYWRLQETSGTTINDSSGNGNVGTYSGVTLAQPSLVPSDPADYSVLVPNSGAMTANAYIPFPAGTEKRSFEIIANRATNTSVDTLWGGSSNSMVTLRCPAGTDDIAFISNTGATGTWTGAMGGTGTTKHLILAYDPTTSRTELFVNGTSLGALTVGGGTGNGTNRIGLGYNNSGLDPWNGYIDEFSIYPGILSAAQVAAHYDAWTASTALGRVAYDFASTNRVRNANYEAGIADTTNGVGFVNAGTFPATVSSTTAQHKFGAASAQVTTGPSVGNSGIEVSLLEPFFAGVQYKMSVWVKGAVGGEGIQFILGHAASGDAAAVGSIPVTSSFAQYTLSWTPTATRASGVTTAIRLGSVSSTIYVDGWMITGPDTDHSTFYDATDTAVGSTVSILTRTASDTLATTDVATCLRIAARTAADTLATTDAAARTNLLRLRTAADSLGTADVTTRAAQLFVRAAADTLATTDAATRANLLRLRTGADTLATTDTASRAALALLRAGVDTLGTADAATRAALLAVRSGSDTLGTSDAAARTVQAFIRAAVDALGTTDSAVGGRFVIKSATDTLGTTDAATRSAQLFLRAAADTLATTDAASRTSVRARTAADTLATTDAATRLAVLLRAAADALGTSDAATRSALLRVRSGADTLGTSDTATRLAVLARNAADALGTSDAASRSAASRLRTAADVLGTADAAVRANLLRLRLAVDSLGTFDSADGFVTHVTAPDLTEPLGALVISYVAKAIATEYVARTLADTPTSKTVTIEPTQKAPTQQESHAKVGVTDYAGKTKVL